MQNTKQWWAPVWTGLVMDEGAKHYRQMRNAVWLFLYLLLNADRKTGFLVRKLRTISADMGLSRDTILRWLNALRKGGYVATRNTGRCLHIQIQKWKPMPGARGKPPQSWPTPNRRSWAKPTPQSKLGPALNRNLPVISGANDMMLKKDILHNDTGSQAAPTSPAGFRPTSREELLAQDLAVALGDRRNLALYLSYARRYPESVLRGILGEAKEVPTTEIHKSRGALFNYLVRQYVQRTTQDPGD